MLKGIDPILSPEFLSILRAMGHGDEIAIVDANYPAEAHARRCVRADGHDLPALLDALLSLMPLDRAVDEAVFRPVPAGDAKGLEATAALHSEYETLVAKHDPGIKVVPLKGAAFYDRVKGAYAIVASGERRLYGNIVLRKGVIHSNGSHL
ncbi:RbsD/FucU family protein [Beijerinckia indica]|uniref:RbsD or FucU transport n=1 Tax=Beijerinckia indica subsp. indica (strain ATCC 9039 / DSM 1715 / NCIMB 8712) TaxID=395963 RepID=B2IKF4_BEII9|nr:RbsD/FucU domain-containing protein [Beijerinckia indica]ACB96434.1 RbsD or FucU transport [Beijerinckia indica subsp. indica ATCC 9039]